MPAFVVHSLPQAVAALTAAAEAHCNVTLWSPPEAARSLGASYFLAMVGAARLAVPEAQASAVLDCGEAVGLAMAALLAGAEAVHVRASPEAMAKLADIAAQQGAALPGEPPEDCLDLGPLSSPLDEARTFIWRSTIQCGKHIAS